MPNIAAWHPQIVHFVIALLLVGVAFRLVSLTGRLKFTSPAATTLLVMGTVAALLAVKSGDQAHGPVERIPGARDAVVEHEEYGERARNVFLVVAALELVALALARRESRATLTRWVHVASAAVGVFGAVPLYEAAEHGGELVYSYAGGPGLRTGEPQDVQRLLLAGLYNQSRVDRREGRSAEAASLVNEMARRFPSDTAVRFRQVESHLLDRNDARAALGLLDSIRVSDTDARWRARHATLAADAYLALGLRDSARVVLTPVVAAFPQNTRLKARLDSLR